MKKRVKRAKLWKTEQVTDLRSMIDAYSTVGIVRIRGLGSKQLQKIRHDFADKARLRVSKNSLISRSLAESGMERMREYVDDQMAVIFTGLDPFELYRVLDAGKIPAPIKAGATAPFDLVVEAGPTSLRPGPIVGELQSLGIPAGIERGKVVIKQQKVVVKEGETVSAPIADMLARLEIYPIREGLDLTAVYDRTGAVLFMPDVLHVDPEQYLADLQAGVKAACSLATRLKYDYPTQFTMRDLLYEASDKARNLALTIAYPTPETIKPLLQKAHAQARSLSVNASIITNETMPALLGKATAAAQQLAARVGE